MYVFKSVLSVLFIALCAGLMGIVLVQHRKSGGFSGNFGGGGTQMDMPGGSWQRMPMITKVTFLMMLAFMVISVILVKIST
jgi:preprotein translocase subunit SecG